MTSAIRSMPLDVKFWNRLSYPAFALVNTGTTAANATLNFYADDGSAQSLPLAVLESGAVDDEGHGQDPLPAHAGQNDILLAQKAHWAPPDLFFFFASSRHSRTAMMTDRPGCAISSRRITSA